MKDSNCQRNACQRNACRWKDVPYMRVFAILLTLVTMTASPNACVADNLSPSVGAPGYIDEILLPGSELTGKPISDNDTMVVRVVKALPTGDGFRYEIRFQGLEAGKFDLSKWLIRKDGSPSDDLPKIEIEIMSLLPPGQIKPNELETGWIPRLGGYRRLAVGAGVLWIFGLLSLIFFARKKKEVEQKAKPETTVADLIRARLNAALENKVDPKQYAELERILFGLWQRKLGLEKMPLDQALQVIRKNDSAGPMMQQLERWMHSPYPNHNVDLAELLKPYKDMPASDLLKTGNAGDQA